MKKKKEIIIAISAILFTLTLFIRMPQALQLILILVAYVLVGKDTVLLAVKKIERGDFLDENFFHKFFKNSFTVVVIYDIIADRSRVFLKNF